MAVWVDQNGDASLPRIMIVSGALTLNPIGDAVFTLSPSDGHFVNEGCESMPCETEGD